MSFRLSWYLLLNLITYVILASILYLLFCLNHWTLDVIWINLLYKNMEEKDTFPILLTASILTKSTSSWIFLVPVKSITIVSGSLSQARPFHVIVCYMFFTVGVFPSLAITCMQLCSDSYEGRDKYWLNMFIFQSCSCLSYAHVLSANPKLLENHLNFVTSHICFMLVSLTP